MEFQFGSDVREKYKVDEGNWKYWRINKYISWWHDGLSEWGCLRQWVQARSQGLEPTECDAWNWDYGGGIITGNDKVWVMTGTEWLGNGQDKFTVVWETEKLKSG